MSVPACLLKIEGKWTGQNRLWVIPDEPERVSEAIASVELVTEGKFLHIRYTWEDEDRPQSGCLLIGGEEKPDRINLDRIEIGQEVG
jgi:hypothetical protein